MLEQVTSYKFINGELPLTCPLAIQAFQLGQQMNTVMLDSYVNDFAHVVSSSSDISKKRALVGGEVYACDHLRRKTVPRYPRSRSSVIIPTGGSIHRTAAAECCAALPVASEIASLSIMFPRFPL